LGALETGNEAEGEEKAVEEVELRIKTHVGSTNNK